MSSAIGFKPRPGRFNDLSDVPGLSVGCAEAGPTGVTVILCDALTPAAVDRRGGGPATRETDLLAPDASIRAVHALTLSGGSVFGLAAADSLVEALSAKGIGLRVTETSPPVPLTPAACLFDLGGLGPDGWKATGGDTPPYARLARAALADAESARAEPRPISLGARGAGRGARSGDGPGGLGAASIDLGDGVIVAALIAANPVGAVRMPDGSAYWAWPFEIDGEFGGMRPGGGAAPAIEPLPPGQTKLAGPPPDFNTVIGVVATSVALSVDEIARFATMAQDGIARAVRPAHTPHDGDTLFALATGAAPASEDPNQRKVLVARLGSAAADCVARAIARGCWETSKTA